MSEKDERKSNDTLKIVLIVVAVVLTPLVLICSVSAFLAAATTMMPKLNSKPRPRTMCANHLRQLSMTHTILEVERGDRAPSFGGPALFVHYRRSGAIEANAEPILLCPADPDAVDPATPGLAERYAAVDLSNVPPDLCSYAVHDFARFGDEPDGTERGGILAACPHHTDGANVVYLDGSVIFVSWAELGLVYGEPATFGPGSNVEEFSKLRYRE